MGRIPTKLNGNGSPIRHMWEVHREIARLQVSGMRPTEISLRLGYTRSWLSTVMNSPVYKRALESLSERADDNAVDIKKRIQEGAETGVVELLRVLKGEGEYKGSVSTSLKVKVAQDFLDREGHGKISTIKQDTTVTVLNATRIEEIKANRQRLLANLMPIQEAQYA
jgi:hypothetical protein